jgi:hypothetical protein
VISWAMKPIQKAKNCLELALARLLEEYGTYTGSTEQHRREHLRQTLALKVLLQLDHVPEQV